jgi:hypothetical protein
MVMEKTVSEPDIPRMAEIREKIEFVKKTLSERRGGYRAEHRRISKELMALTIPVIRGFVDDLHGCLGRAKLQSEILSTAYDGRSGEGILTIKSNKAALLAFRKMVSDGVALLETMRLQPISAIEREGKRLRDEIETFAWKAEETEKISESNYYRGAVPAGLTLASKDYSGPMTSLRK